MEDLVTSALPVHNENTSILEPQASGLMATEWTDEKHSLYLKSMEASFVSQLYNSSDFLGWRSQEDYSSNPKSSTRNPSCQFKVLRDGCWEMVNLKRNQAHTNKAGGSNVLTANPWIRHFRSGAVQEKAALATTSNRLSTSRANVCQQDLVGSDTDNSQLNIEMSDQNFVDEDVVREKPSRKCSTKRMRTSASTTSGRDQVVPFRKFPVTAEVVDKRISSRK
ncbi:hypothetical protein LguiA_003803 [Lonicera macranthoides]